MTEEEKKLRELLRECYPALQIAQLPGYKDLEVKIWKEFRKLEEMK